MVKSKSQSEKYTQFGRLFGQDVHMLESANVDSNYKHKEKSVSISVPAILHTIKSVRVNTLRQANLPGGVAAVIINGGEKEITIGLDEEILMSASSFSESREKKAFFGNYQAANDLCNAANRAELARLDAIENDIKAQKSVLRDVIEANERALAGYQND